MAGEGAAAASAPLSAAVPAPATPPGDDVLPTASRRGTDHLATRLAGVATREEVLEVVADESAAAVGAEMVNISLLDDADPTLLRLLTTRHTPSHVRDAFQTYPVDAPLPARDALADRRPVLLRSMAERDERYPALAGIRVRGRAFAILPLLHGEQVLGVIGFGWNESQDFPEGQVTALEVVTRLCAAALSRADLYRAEQRARRAAEDLAERLATLQQLTQQLAAASELQAVGDVVVSAAMRALGADAATVAVLEPGGTQLRRIADQGVPASRITSSVLIDVDASPLTRDMMTSRLPVFVTSTTDRDARYPDMADVVGMPEAWANLPLLVRGRVVGAASFGWKAARSFSPADTALMDTLAAHTAIAIDRAQLLAAAQAVAETLQRALLPDVAAGADGWDLATFYAPAVEGTQVGGDWYDAFALPDGRIGLALGDVMGKGVRAAAVMGSVRAALRAFATVDASPDVVLGEVDGYLTAFGQDEFVTCWYGVLDPATGRLDHCSAGHLPALLTGPDGHRWLEEATSPPLGVHGGPRGEAGARRCSRVVVAPGEVLVLYTDGLVEDRHRSLAVGLDSLARLAGALPTAPRLEPAVAELVHGLTAGAANVDDVAVLAVRRAAP